MPDMDNNAEHFTLEDEEFIQYVKLLREGKIEMYMNKQPCFKSTTNTVVEIWRKLYGR